MATYHPHQHTPEEPDLPSPLREALQGLYQPPGTVPPAVDEAVAEQAWQHFEALRDRRRTRVWGRVAIAAAAVFALFVLDNLPRQTGSTVAKADDSMIIAALKSGAAFFYFVQLADPFMSDDPADPAREQALAKAKADRDLCIKAVEESKTFSDPRTKDLWHSWQRYYEGLRDLGRREECFDEARKACDFALNNPAGEKVMAWYPVYLDGLANSYLRFGEYAAARAAYGKSIEIREAEIRRIVAEPGYEHRLEAQRAQKLGPMFLRLTTLCLAEGNTAEARRWCDQAEGAMRDWMVKVCRLDHQDVPPDASMWEAWDRLPEEFRSPRDSSPSPQEQLYWAERLGRHGGEPVDVPECTMVMWTQAVLYHRALLAVAAEDYAAAEQALDRAESIKDFPAQDELRLCFYIPLLRARLAILAHKDYSAALRSLDEATSKSGAIKVPADPNLDKLAISPARMAELHLLRGLALLGLDEHSAEGAALVKKALAIPEKLAANLPAEQHEKFLSQFAAWAKLTHDNAQR